MQVSKSELIPGELYFMVHKETGNMICAFDKVDGTRLVFRVLWGGIDYRTSIRTKPNMASYYTIGTLDVDL